MTKRSLQITGGLLVGTGAILAMIGTYSLALFIFYAVIVFIGAILLKTSENMT